MTREGSHHEVFFVRQSSEEVLEGRGQIQPIKREVNPFKNKDGNESLNQRLQRKIVIDEQDRVKQGQDANQHDVIART